MKTTDLNPFYVFIKTPSLPELESRLKVRHWEFSQIKMFDLKSYKNKLYYLNVLHKIMSYMRYNKCNVHV